MHESSGCNDYQPTDLNLFHELGSERLTDWDVDCSKLSTETTTSIEGLWERTEYVPLRSQGRGRKPVIICSVLPPEIVMHDAFNVIL